MVIPIPNFYELIRKLGVPYHIVENIDLGHYFIKRYNLIGEFIVSS